jgi:hypothetical protein
METWALRMDAWSLKMESRRVGGPVIANYYHYGDEQDPDPY